MFFNVFVCHFVIWFTQYAIIIVNERRVEIKFYSIQFIVKSHSSANKESLAICTTSETNNRRNDESLIRDWLSAFQWHLFFLSFSSIQQYKHIDWINLKNWWNRASTHFRKRTYYLHCICFRKYYEFHDKLCDIIAQTQQNDIDCI